MASCAQVVGIPSSKAFIVNSISSVRHVAPQPCLRNISVEIHIPVPPRQLDKPILYLAKCHTWFTTQKEIENTPEIQVSLGFLESKYP